MGAGCAKTPSRNGNQQSSYSPQRQLEGPLLQELVARSDRAWRRGQQRFRTASADCRPSVTRETPPYEELRGLVHKIKDLSHQRCFNLLFTVPLFTVPPNSKVRDQEWGQY